MPPRTRFPLVDSLRAIGALAILGTHAGALVGLYGGGSALAPYVARLDVGVAIFFLVSGFLLYRPFARARLQELAEPRARAYAWRRFLRIAPGYWVALTLGAIAFTLPGVFSSDGIPTYYLMGQGYRIGTIGGGLAQGWTLTVEVAFYAFLPVFAFAMSRVGGATRRARLRGELVAIGALFVVALAYKLVVLKGLGSQPITITPKLLALPAYLDQFALGMLLAVTSLWLEGRGTLPRPLAVIDRWPWLPWLGAAVAFWAVATQVGLPRTIYTPITATEYMERHLLYAAVGLGLLLPAVIGREDRGWVRRLMATRVLVWLGLVSYGIYLYNLLVMSKLNAWGADDLLPIGRYGSLAVTGFVVTIIGAALSWYFVERPALSLKGRVPARTPAVRDGREA